MSDPISAIRSALVAGLLEFTRLGDGSSVLLCISSRNVASLNESATLLIERLLAGDACLDDLCAAITPSNIGIPPQQIKQDVEEFLGVVKGMLAEDES